MSENMTPCPADHPLMIAWKKYEATDEFSNSKKWAAYPEHLTGSLWAAFMAGFESGLVTEIKPTERNVS